MKIIRACLQTVYNVSRNFGASDSAAEVIAQVVVESTIAMAPAMVIAALPPLPSRYARLQATYLATCWGGMLQAVVHPEVRGWIKWRAEVLQAAQAQEVVGDDIVFEN
jgi:hypothetical protein